MVAPTNDFNVLKETLKNINQWEDDKHAVITAIIENEIAPTDIMSMGMDNFDNLKCTPEGRSSKQKLSEHNSAAPMLKQFEWFVKHCLASQEMDPGSAHVGAGTTNSSHDRNARHPLGYRSSHRPNPNR